MSLAYFLILFPIIPAILFLFLKNYGLQKWVVIASCAIIAVASIVFALGHFHPGGQYIDIVSVLPNKLITIGDIILALAFLYICRKLSFKQYWIPLLVIIQYGAIIFYELAGKIPNTFHTIYIDGLSAVMALIIGIVGTLITVYTVRYMKNYHEDHPDIKNRSHLFIATVYLFFFAMFGVVFSNSLMWMYFFWEITTFCSFIMISYSQKEEAIQNAFRALWMLLVGGLAFSCAIIFLADKAGTIELQKIIMMHKGIILLPVLLLCFAGMNKAALYPFGNWLVGAMVAPTPASALLHSSTMVKAGVYLVLRCAPVIHDTVAGFMIALIGGLSFIAASAIAISQTDGKKILAYSTIANLGLIVLCAGVGTAFTLWAAVLIIIFHAIAKALMFLSLGVVQQQTGSQNIEDMEGLIAKMPLVAITMLIGITGMFLAPFGLLISKWAVLEALTTRNPIFSAIVIFGGSCMLFFWAKWMGKLIVVNKREYGYEKDIGLEWVALLGLSILSILACVFYPVIGKYCLVPLYGNTPMLTYGVEITIGLMLALMLFPPIVILLRKKHLVYVQPYLSGVNLPSSSQYLGSFGEPQTWSFRNYYLESFFGEAVLLKWTIIFSLLLTMLMFFIVLL